MRSTPSDGKDSDVDKLNLDFNQIIILKYLVQNTTVILFAFSVAGLICKILFYLYKTSHFMWAAHIVGTVILYVHRRPCSNTLNGKGCCTAVCTIISPPHALCSKPKHETQQPLITIWCLSSGLPWWWWWLFWRLICFWGIIASDKYIYIHKFCIHDQLQKSLGNKFPDIWRELQ